MTSTPPTVTSSTKAVLAIPADTSQSSRTRLLAAVRSGVARMVRATMSSSGPRELAARSRNHPLMASRMRLAMSGKPGPLPNGNGSRSRMPPLPDGEVVVGTVGAGAVVVGVDGGPGVLVEVGAGSAGQAGEPASTTTASSITAAAVMGRTPWVSSRWAIGSHPDDLLEQGDQPGCQRRQAVADGGGAHAPLGLVDLLGLAGGEQVAQPGDGELQG